MDYRTIHFATQYLAAAAHSFIDHKENHHHLELIWSTENNILHTQALNDFGYVLGLDFSSFVLKSLNKDLKCFGSSIIEGKTHAGILKWIREKTLNINPDKR